MILELDCGNSRIKWRLVNARLLVEHSGSLSWFEFQAGALPEIFAQVGVVRVRIGSVAAAEITEGLVAALRVLFAVEPEVVRVVSPCAGIRCGYDDPLRLGVDRWLAVLAAAAEFPSRDLVVVDAGSAITVDLVSPGLHRGGFIGPGLHMMRDALFAGTAKVKVPDLGRDLPSAVATNTERAVSGALRMMHLGLVEQCRQRFSKNAVIVLTGGDAESLLAELPGSVWRPALVLDGLRLALP